MAPKNIKPLVSGASSEWAEAEARRWENAARMDGVDSVDEMLVRRALPSAPSADESGGE